jgi:hypothetical protein
MDLLPYLVAEYLGRLWPDIAVAVVAHHVTVDHLCRS